MADNVAITAGAGTTIATDERTIAATAVQVQRVYDMGATAIATGQTTVTNTVGGTSIAAATETRKRIVILNRQSVAVYVGASGLTTSTGLRLDPGDAVTLYTTAAVYGITAAAYTATSDDKCHYLEETSA